MKRIILLITAVIFISACGPNPKDFTDRMEPKIIKLARQKVIYIEAKGNPDSMAGAVGALYQTWFKLKYKNKKIVPPKARWPKPFETPMNEWVGIWALPVPEEINVVPAIKNSTYTVKTGYWDYGETGEIVHFGPYDKEAPVIEKLKSFVRQNGYEVLPETHEEEYIKGPGMFGKGNPEKYITIIRYTLIKK